MTQVGFTRRYLEGAGLTALSISPRTTLDLKNGVKPPHSKLRV